MSIILGDIQQAYYTAAQWTAWNGILLAGQKGIESDTLKEKVGDGVTAWISLAYSSIPAQSLSNVLGVGNTTGANDIVATNNSKYRNSDGSVNLNISNSALIDFTNTDGLYTYSLDSDATSQYIQMRSYDNATTLELAYLQTFYQQVNMGVYSASTGGKLTQLEITNGEIRTNIVNNAAFEGIKYGADYSANYTNRSLVDKGYVTGNFQPLDADLTSWAAITRASGFDTFVATPSSANLASLVTDETGSGALVFGTSPTFTTDITTPLIIGGSSVGSTIQYKGTSGNGTSTVAAHQFLVGNNGATTAAQVFNSGQVSIGNYASPTNLRLFTIGQDTAYMSFGSLVGATSFAAIYMNQASPSSTNHVVAYDGSNLQINTATNLYLMRGGVARYAIETGGLTHGWSVNTISSGAYTPYTFTVGANTGQTASTEISNFKVNGASKTWAAGTITTQRWNYFTANTAAFASASTITNSYGLYVEAAIAGTNATITNNYAAGFSGSVQITNVGTSAVSLNLDGSAGTGGSTTFNIFRASTGVSGQVVFSTSTTNQFSIGLSGTVATNDFVIRDSVSAATRFQILRSAVGQIGLHGVTPTALLTLAAGTATASTAPLKFTTGTNLSVAEAGVMEYNNTFHLTNSDATRRHVVLAPNTTKVTAAAPYANDGYIVINIGGTDFKVMTTA